jgi:O-acetyl-ADP-ribose deacetylase (regulator of RNase III)
MLEIIVEDITKLNVDAIVNAGLDTCGSIARGL